MDFNSWWAGNRNEVYWLEVTDRKDLGVDLNAPQRREDAQEYYGYSLIREIREGDIIFHYHKGARAIVAWSRATGESWEDQVVWAAHGTVARNAGLRPYTRPGWRLGLAGTLPLLHPLTLEDLRAAQDKIQLIRDQLETNHGKPVYFPFEPADRRDLRPTQAYLTKFPAQLLELFPSLRGAMARKTESSEHRKSGTRIEEQAGQDALGAPYRRADEDVAISERDPFSIDPALVERANKGHAATQNALALYLERYAIEPRSPAPHEPNFDIAWQVGDTTFVAEVKSLTDSNEDKQLRLGLGQVLHYRHGLQDKYPLVIAIILLERRPSDTGWDDLCRDLGVLLLWPEVLDSRLSKHLQRDGGKDQTFHY